MEQEIEVRYTVELSHKIKVPAGKTPFEAASEFTRPIYDGADAVGKTVPESASLRFVRDLDGKSVSFD
jgi:hypothetical protein